jgi:hypothetical protein
VLRRIRHQSSGDLITAKRPDAGPYAARVETLIDGPQIFDAD